MLEDGAEAEVWESYGSEDPELDAVLNSVVELRVGDGARLRYVCKQDISEQSWIFATQRAEVGRDGSLDWTALGFGSARGKVRMETKLAGQGSEARVTGAYAGGGSQHLDFDTTQEHAAPNTFSDLAFRGVLADRGTAVWRGMIRVDPGAQQTDAFQESRNLLLSTKAHADAIPGLEIEANDVRCTHAAAVAQIDREQLHYLRARGLDEETARRLIIEAFLEALVERLGEGRLRDEISGALEKRLGRASRRLGPSDFRPQLELEANFVEKRPLAAPHRVHTVRNRSGALEGEAELRPQPRPELVPAGAVVAGPLDREVGPEPDEGAIGVAPLVEAEAPAIAVAATALAGAERVLAGEAEGGDAEEGLLPPGDDARAVVAGAAAIAVEELRRSSR